jgi:peptide methionine sulfoxide reductase MsrB
MTGREKVIKGLKCCFNPHSENSCLCHCSECPYDSQDDNNWTQHCQIELNRDALKLLKEQKAVVPTLIREGRNKYNNDYVCPGCDNELFYGQNYCSECGRPVKWE